MRLNAAVGQTVLQHFQPTVDPLICTGNRVLPYFKKQQRFLCAVLHQLPQRFDLPAQKQQRRFLLASLCKRFQLLNNAHHIDNAGNRKQLPGLQGRILTQYRREIAHGSLPICAVEQLVVRPTDGEKSNQPMILRVNQILMNPFDVQKLLRRFVCSSLMFFHKRPPLPLCRHSAFANSQTDRHILHRCKSTGDLPAGKISRQR